MGYCKTDYGEEGSACRLVSIEFPCVKEIHTFKFSNHCLKSCGASREADEDDEDDSGGMPNKPNSKTKDISSFFGTKSRPAKKKKTAHTECPLSKLLKARSIKRTNSLF